MREPMRPTSKSICEAADRTGARAWQGAMEGGRAVPGAEKGIGGRGSCSLVSGANFRARLVTKKETLGKV